jgi:hypothetical protein
VVLGLVRVGEGIARAVLTEGGVTPAEVERSVAEQPATEAAADVPRWWGSVERPIGLWVACSLVGLFSFFAWYTIAGRPYSAWAGSVSGIPCAVGVAFAALVAGLARGRAGGAGVPRWALAAPAMAGLVLCLYTWWQIDASKGLMNIGRWPEGGPGLWGSLVAFLAILGFIAAEVPEVRRQIASLTERNPSRRTT